MHELDSPVACPWCRRDFPVIVQVRALTICPHCLHTCALEDFGPPRVATTPDVDALTPTELAGLRLFKKQARTKAATL